MGQNMAEFTLDYSTKTTIDNVAPEKNEVVVPVVLNREIKKMLSMKKSKYSKEYIGTRAGKIPVTFTTIEKNNEANYKKVFDEEIEYYKAQDIDVEESLFSRCMVPDNKSKGYTRCAKNHSCNKCPYKELKELEFYDRTYHARGLAHLDQPIGEDDDGEYTFIDICDKSADVEMILKVKGMIQELKMAIKDNTNFKIILNMKLNGCEEKEIVKHLKCSKPTAYKELKRFKKLAAQLWNIDYEE